MFNAERLILQDVDIKERVSQAPKQRISIYCIAESLDRKLLEKRLEARGPSWLISKYPDVLYGQYASLENPVPTGVSARALLVPCYVIMCIQQ